MTVLEYLDQNHCDYKVTEHEPVYTAEQLASAEHVPERQVAKPVAVLADGSFYLCVLPANRMIDMYALQRLLHAKHVRLANEKEMAQLFADAELGAEPPLGNHYNVPTLMDKKLAKDKQIIFQAGTHNKAVWMSMKQYRKLANPTIAKFSYPAYFERYEPFYLYPEF